MKILQVVADGKLGGGTSVVLDMCAEMIKLTDLEINAICQENSYLFYKLKTLNIKTYGLNFFRSRFNIFLCWQLNKIIKNINPDIIHVHGSRAAFFIGLSKKIHRNFKIPIIYTAHGYSFRHKPLLIKWLFILCEKMVSRSFECVVNGCYSDKNLTIKYGLVSNKSHHEVIYNIVRINGIEKYGKTLDKNNKKILFIGRLVYQKDPFLFLNIANSMKNECFEFHMVGDGALKNKIEHYITRYNLNGKVILYGAQSRDKVLEILSSSAVLVLCSYWEVLPIVIREAFLLKIPVITINVDGVAEVVEHLQTGYLITERNPKIFKHAILTLNENKELADKIVNNAYKFAIDNFSNEKCINSYISCYEQLVDN